MKLVSTGFVFHANLLYAEFRFDHIPEIVKTCYVPFLKILLENPGFKGITLNWTGWTLEVLNGDYPEHGEYGEVIDLLKELISKKQVEITGTSYSHAVLPLYTLEDAYRHVEMFGKTIKRILNYQPKGYWPPELAVDPLLPMVLEKNGYEWTIIDNDTYDRVKADMNVENVFVRHEKSFTQQIADISFANPLKQLLFVRKQQKLLRESTDYQPFIWKGTAGSEILTFRDFYAWTALTLSCLSQISIMKPKRLIKALTNYPKKYRGYFIPFCSDIEFFGFGGNIREQSVPLERFERVMKQIYSNKDLEFVLPSDYTASIDKKSLTKSYVKTGAWTADKSVELWDKDPDNRRLNSFCQEVRDRFIRVVDKMPEQEREETWKYIILSQNSDGRGWTPIAEKRLWCYDQAIKALNIVEKYE
ncbi:MAG: hypothetical protein ACTSRU_16110 [Candidatus Hodarchaeales archaeon]